MRALGESAGKLVSRAARMHADARDGRVHRCTPARLRVFSMHACTRSCVDTSIMFFTFYALNTFYSCKRDRRQTVIICLFQTLFEGSRSCLSCYSQNTVLYFHLHMGLSLAWASRRLGNGLGLWLRRAGETKLFYLADPVLQWGDTDF